jgi:hypothetical protein
MRRLSRAWKRERSGRWKASAAAGCSAGHATPQPYRGKELRGLPVLCSPLHPLQCLALGVYTPERDDTHA